MRRPIIGIVAILIGTVAFVGVAAPASAVPQLVMVTATFAPPNPWHGGDTVPCPASTVALGGGVAIVGDAQAKTYVHVDGFGPNLGGIWGAAQNHEAETSPSPWSVRVTAICGAVNGWETVEAVGVMVGPDETIKTATATCPAGKKVIGAGGHDGKAWNFKLIGVDPSPDLTSVTVKAATVVTGPYVNGFKAYAVCANPQRIQQLVTATSPTNTQNKLITVSCPGNLSVHGLGGGVVGAGGYAHITRLEPVNTTTAVLEASGPPTGLVQGWSAHIHAICAP
jgi:hypothetical protein